MTDRTLGQNRASSIGMLASRCIIGTFVVDPAPAGLQLCEHVDGDGAMTFDLSVGAEQSPVFVQLG